MEQIFHRYSQSDLFIARTSSNQYWCAYLYRGKKKLNDTISISETFDNFGHYLFMASQFPQENIDDFIKKIDDCINNKINNYHTPPISPIRLCLWIDYSKSSSTIIEESSYPLYFVTEKNPLTLVSNFPINSSLTFIVPSGLQIGVNEKGLFLHPINPPTNFTQNIYFATSKDGYGPSINVGVEIPFVNNTGGSFSFHGEIPKKTLIYFNAGVCYTFGKNQSHCFYPVIPLDPNEQILNYVGFFDPLDPTNVNYGENEPNLRTFFALSEDSSLKSCLCTDTGKEISLVPQIHKNLNSDFLPNTPALIFEYLSSEESRDNRDGYMSFAGDFALKVDGESTQDNTKQNLLCGIFGTETISFRAYSSNNTFDVLRFIPRCPAYAPTFPLNPVSLNNLSDFNSDKLDLTHRTSWITFINGENTNDENMVHYISQPDNSPLFHNPGTNSNVSLLDVFNPKIKFPQSSQFAIPMAFYAGLDSSLNDDVLGSFESQILSSTRNKKITNKNLSTLQELKNRQINNTLDSDSIISTTPQGLLVNVDTVGGDNYTKIILANYLSQQEIKYFEFDNPSAPLQHMFQTNQLFSVIVNNQYLEENPQKSSTPPPTFQKSVTVAGWTMTAQVGNGVSTTDYRNVMIFKYCKGTVLDLVNNPTKWTSPNDFSVVASNSNSSLEGDSNNISLLGLSQWLNQFLNNAIESNKTSTLYDNFVNIIQDENWNGILVLRADIDPEGFPDQIKGLSAGIDMSVFEAHHFGITASRIKTSSSGVEIDGHSSIFGLIDYQNPLFRQNLVTGGNPDVPLGIPTSGPYDFTVLQLQSLFQNSALVDFKSRIQLSINKLFDAPVLQTSNDLGLSSVNAIVIPGKYQKQGNTNSYIFEQDSPVNFLVNSNVLDGVFFNKIQFNTLKSKSSQKLHSRFLIWGLLNFNTLQYGPKEDIQNLDVLSFGTVLVSNISEPFFNANPIHAPPGLAFSNLIIDLESPITVPNSITYTFDTNSISLELVGSTPRIDSLFSAFPLELEGFVSSSEKKPSDLGYLPVNLDDVSLDNLSDTWFGISYNVDMGTPGSLAEKIGFKSRLLIAWSCKPKSSDSYPVYVGIQLPGTSPGAKIMSIQGILKISIDSVQLLHNANIFNLKFNDVSLKFFGIAKLPSSASINFFLFGDPQNSGSLGWYAAYRSDENKNDVLVSLDSPQLSKVLSKSNTVEKTL